MPERTTSLEDFNTMAVTSAAAVIAGYSTSFSLATKLLRPAVRDDIRNLYAVVRIADEIVDGTAADAGYSDEQIRAELDAFEKDVYRTIDSGFSTNPAVHAFGLTARSCSIDKEHLRAFFRSMRADIDTDSYGDRSLGDYIYGSAEVIGLMCLSVFLRGTTPDPATAGTLHEGARRLGAAFQKINFLRDLGEDRTSLGRTYFEGTADVLTEQKKDALVAEIRDDLDCARRAIPHLPYSARAAVLAAHDLFESLTDTIDSMPASTVMTTRASVNGRKKILLMAIACGKAVRMGDRG
ncbi:phytoene/squalene synthase family protein [Corynebacterium mendelii]|uniref:Phytoene/squalene synthase family protein n=1 Tax=Corynebacterium mendelii TaxID=2765362 RepID=A0A939E0J0_9CORY|nr:phytoene/squalene synthase family protein [Corynebacterium mendelii]MBN9644220.1 phytoene/squalene synthase family protein [Corynebacterium mendelii]